MWVGRPGFGVQVVTVVPDHQQSQVVYRGEGCGAGPDHRPHLTAAHRQPTPVAFGRAQLSGQCHVAAGAQHGGAGGVEPDQVAPVGHHGHHSASGGQRRADRLGDPDRPVLAGQRRPDRPGGTTGGDRTQPRTTSQVPRPSGRVGWVGDRGGTGHAGTGLGAGMSGRQGQSQHVGHRTGPAVGDRARQPGDLGTQYRLGGDHALQEGQSTGVVAVRDPFQEHRVNELSGEPHPNPYPGHRLAVQRGRHEIVERPVQVRQRHVHDQPRHRITRGRLPHLRAAGAHDRSACQVTRDQIRPRCWSGPTPMPTPVPAVAAPRSTTTVSPTGSPQRPFWSWDLKGRCEGLGRTG